MIYRILYIISNLVVKVHIYICICMYKVKVMGGMICLISCKKGKVNARMSVDI